MEVDTIELFTLLLAFLGVWHYITKNDEFILLLVAFFYLTGISRYNAVLSGRTEWVVVAYAYNIFNLNNELALKALNYFFLGTAVFSISYFLLNQNKPTPQPVDNDEFLSVFLQKKQKIIIGLYIFFLIFNTYASFRLDTAAVAYGMSYFFLFKLALGGLILLFFMLLKNLPKNKIINKIIYIVLIIGAAGASYSSQTRFQFLSWMVALAFIMVGRKNIIIKAIFYAVGGTVAIFAFMIAGNMRHSALKNADFEHQIEYAKYRMQQTEDQNMLDGFMMVLQVYPQYLDYGYGSEHFEILLRPIPRALWPDKPVGGYANKLGLNDNMENTTVGISQSIYGTFYGEGGVEGIIIFSILYAILFTQLFKSTRKYNSDMRYLLHGIIFTSMIPILRGGDLPGIVAFIGMSYWPVFVFLWLYKRELKRVAINKQIMNKKNISSLQNLPTSEVKTI